MDQDPVAIREQPAALAGHRVGGRRHRGRDRLIPCPHPGGDGSRIAREAVGEHRLDHVRHAGLVQGGLADGREVGDEVADCVVEPGGIGPPSRNQQCERLGRQLRPGSRAGWVRIGERDDRGANGIRQRADPGFVDGIGRV